MNLEAKMVTFSEITIKYTDEEISEVLYSERGDEGIPLTDEELVQLINELSIYLDDRHK